MCLTSSHRGNVNTDFRGAVVRRRVGCRQSDINGKQTKKEILYNTSCKNWRICLSTAFISGAVIWFREISCAEAAKRRDRKLPKRGSSLVICNNKQDFHLEEIARLNGSNNRGGGDIGIKPREVHCCLFGEFALPKHAQPRAHRTILTQFSWHGSVCKQQCINSVPVCVDS